MPKNPPNESGFFPENKLPPPDKKQAERISLLTKTRDLFSDAILEFRSLLKDAGLASDRTQGHKDRLTKNLSDLNGYAGDLEKINAGEGVFSLIFTTINSLFTLRDEINDLKFQNLSLYKRLVALERCVVPLQPKEPSKPE